MLTPLGYPLFRWLLIGFLLSAVGTSMQDVGAEWLMTDQTLHPLQVALLVTAIRLPRVLLGIPAGVIADRFGSRKILLVTQGWMLVVATVMAILVASHALTPWLLILLTFALFLGMATQDPAMFAGFLELVPSREIPAALALQFGGFALARLLGPALAGMAMRVMGPASVFAANAVTYVAPVVVLVIFSRRWQPAEPVAAESEPEPNSVSVRESIANTVLLIRSSTRLQALLLFSAFYTFCVTAQASLFPIVARTHLHLTSTRFGWAMSLMNGGSIVGTFLVPRLLRSVRINVMVATALVVAGAAIMWLPRLQPSFIFGFCLVLGVAFAILEMGLFTAAQADVPTAMRGRVTGAILTVFAVGSTAGSITWGGVATRFGVDHALLIAGALTVVAGGLAVRSGLTETTRLQG